MIKFQKTEILAGIILLLTAAGQAVARENNLEESESLAAENSANSEWDGPNVLDTIMLQDTDTPASPTPVNGGYIAGIVLQQNIRANSLQSEVGLQLFHEGERLDPRRHQVEWKLVTSPSPSVKARFVNSADAEFGQKVQIETPLTTFHTRVLGTMEIEARITDREQPDKAPLIVVQTLRELLSNGRDGL